MSSANGSTGELGNCSGKSSEQLESIVNGSEDTATGSRSQGLGDFGGSNTDKTVHLDLSDSSSSTKKTTKRTDYLEWQEYFMAIAFLSAQRSKDPNTQVGACIVNEENKIVGIGYNGMPTGCSDDLLPWAREGETILDTKYPFVCHAEMNAIMNKNSTHLKNCTIYVSLFPCNECAKLVIQSRITKVVYMLDKYHEKPEFIASRRLLTMAGVELQHFKPKQSGVQVDFKKFE